MVPKVGIIKGMSPDKVDIVLLTLRSLGGAFREAERPDRTLHSKGEEPELNAVNKKGHFKRAEIILEGLGKGYMILGKELSSKDL